MTQNEWDRQIEEDVQTGRLDKLAEASSCGTQSRQDKRTLKHFASLISGPATGISGGCAGTGR